MATFIALASASKSLERMLDSCYDDDFLGNGKRPRAQLVRTEDFKTAGSKTDSSLPETGLTVFVYRIDFNKAMRAAWSAVGQADGRAHLPLDLHFLITPWAGNAQHELQILGRAIECLEATPILSGPLLDPAGGWAPEEAIQVVLEEVGTEAIMRTFDSLPIDYKLSVAYIARVVRIDSQRAVPAPPTRTVVVGERPGVNR
jgi:hypothetical protein